MCVCVCVCVCVLCVTYSKMHENTETLTTFFSSGTKR